MSGDRDDILSAAAIANAYSRGWTTPEDAKAIKDAQKAFDEAWSRLVREDRERRLHQARISTLIVAAIIGLAAITILFLGA